MKKKSKSNNLAIGIIIILLTIVSILTILWINHSKETNQNNTPTNNSITTTTQTGEQIDWSKYQTKDITLTKSITITEGGIYNLTGTIEDGLIQINTKDNIKLILNNVTIKNTNGPSIYVENAENIVIETENNTKNTLEDSTSYTGYEEEVNSVIYSKDTLILDGTGALNIIANYQDGIVSKDDLQILNGTYTINAKDDGIRGKDSVYIKEGKFTITTTGDGIKTTNTTDTEKGYIKIENGTFNITSELDAFQAETKITILNGTYEITTGGGSSNKSTHTDWGQWGNWQSPETEDTTPSAKGIKAAEIIIQNGNFNLNTSDDAIHANDTTTIRNGTYQIKSGDDGIHADTKVEILDGTIKIEESYEGLEAAQINIENGNINITATDDGINIAGGNDNSGMNRPGANNYTNTSNYLTINDGTIYVNAAGDGIDVNGSATINGGTITVDGPTNGGNGAIDYDQNFTIKGGIIIATGSKEMAQEFSNDSTQNSINIFLTSTQQANTAIAITKENETIISYTPSKSYSLVQISSPDLEENTEYTIKIGNETYETFTISSTITTIGNNASPGNNQIPGMPIR